MTDTLLETIEDGVAVLTMNRPDRRNALNGDMLEAMLEALPRLANDHSVGCVILTGSEGAFCAGGDVKAMAEGREKDNQSLEVQTQELRNVMETSRWLHEMPKPTIAMIGGAAAGAGLSLALSCDIRIASNNAKLTTAFANVGFSGDFGGSYFLTKLVGTAKARELYYTAALLMAEEAAALGMVNHAVPEDKLLEVTHSMAKGLAAGPSIAYRYMKRNMNAAEAGNTLSEHLDLEAAHHARCGMTEDHKEATKAFVEKRKPEFVGR